MHQRLEDIICIILSIYSIWKRVNYARFRFSLGDGMPQHRAYKNPWHAHVELTPLFSFIDVMHWRLGLPAARLRKEQRRSSRSWLRRDKRRRGEWLLTDNYDVNSGGAGSLLPSQVAHDFRSCGVTILPRVWTSLPKSVPQSEARPGRGLLLPGIVRRSY